MTLQASFPISASQINTELRRASNAAFDIQGLTERALAAVPSGAISMSDFLGKQAVKQVATAGPDAIGTSHSFAGVNFGPDFPNRTIVVLFFAMDRNATWPGTVTISNISIGNAATAHDVNFWFYQGSAPTTLVGTQSQSAAPTGTSGTISFTTSQNTKMYIVVFSLYNVVDYVATTKDGNFSNGLSLPVTLDTIPANSLILGGAIKQGGAGVPTIGFTNMTVIGSANPVGGYYLGWGFINRLSATTSYVVTATAVGGEGGGTQTGFATVVDAFS